MTHTISVHDVFSSFGRFLEHAAVVVVGVIMMVVGLGLGVTMIMLPVGLTIGLLGFGLVVSGVFARLE
jgi:hypothetical protein